VSGGSIEGERLTPTGAALLTTLADAWGPLPSFRPAAVGYGSGTKVFPGTPNLLRMTIGTGAAPDAAATEIVVLEATMDDATPQALAYAADRLSAAGALDVFVAPVQMKKGRLGHLLTVLGRLEDFGSLADVVFRETTTLGLRFRREHRRELSRRLVPVRTPYGRIRVKVGSLDGVAVQVWPEYEDCAAAARKGRVPLKEVQRAALLAYRSTSATTGARAKDAGVARQRLRRRSTR
jgi:uncharacterized protein (DUF111 family)